MLEMVEAYENNPGNYVAIMEVSDADTSKYGIIEPVKGYESQSSVAIQGMVEKPKENPPSNLAIIGRYILSPQVFEILNTQKPGAGGEIQLTDALKKLCDLQPFYGCRFSGQRFDCGSKMGMLKASLHEALKRPEMAQELQLEMLRLLQLDEEAKKCA